MFRYIYQKMPSIINMKYSLYMNEGRESLCFDENGVWVKRILKSRR